LADATLARQLGISRFTILKAKRALTKAGLVKTINAKKRGCEWKNEPTVWHLFPSYTPHGQELIKVSRKKQGGVSEKTGGCLHPVSISVNTKKRSSGAFTGPQNTLLEDNPKGKDGVAGGLEAPATVLPSGKSWKDVLFP
jgi:hypothetical protein